MTAPLASPPLYEAMADKIEKLIRAGTLRPGERIPSVRRAGEQHGVSVTTAVHAYMALEDRGLIEARPKSGFFVRRLLRAQLLEPKASRPAATASGVGVASLQARLFDAVRMPEVVPFGAATPSSVLLPSVKLSRIMASVSRRAVRQGVSYDMPPGSESLRREIARRSLDWGSHLSQEEFITTCGCTEALTLCLRAVTRPDDVVAVESPTYFGALQAMEELQLKALEIPTHPRHGMDLDSLEKAVGKRRIAACLAVPNFNNPLGSLMPDENKRRLLEILAPREIPLIEDDIHGDLHFGPRRPRAAQSYDGRGLVMLCGSISKTLAPGYRVGWVAPGRFYAKVKSLKLTSTLATASLPQLAVAEFMANGGYDHHLRSLRQTLAAQIARMSSAITECFPGESKMTRPQGGFVLWVELPPGADSLELHRRAILEKISVAPGPMFSACEGFRNYIRINCGHPWSQETEKAVQTLGRLVAQLL